MSYDCWNASVPPSKAWLKEHFGAISFQLAFANLDLIGIRLKKSGEVIIITYRGAKKTGFIYEGDALTTEDVFQIYNDVPKSWNDLLKVYDEKFGHLVDILAPHKDLYVWLNENEIVKIGKKKH